MGKMWTTQIAEKSVLFNMIHNIPIDQQEKDKET